MHKFLRRRWTLSGLASVSLVLAACGTSSGPSQPVSSTPHVGGTLTIAISTDPTTLNHNVTDNPDDDTIHRLYGNGLVTESGKEVIQPSLATSWTISPDGLTYTFNLRHGVKWSDGKPFTSADVVFTLEKFLPIAPGPAGAAVAVFKDANAVGPYQVAMHLTKPYAPFLNAVTDSNLMIEPEHVYGNANVVSDNHANDNPIGTGPFIFVKWIHGQKIIFKRNPHYWGATKSKPLPWISQIVVDVIPNPATTVEALLNGSIDYVPDSELPTTAIKQLQNSACCRAVLVHDTPSFNLLWTNTTKAPFNNPTVRKALYMAINRKTVIQDALAGYGTPSLAPIPNTYADLYDPSINLDKQYPYDPKKAGQMLDQAGFPVKNGERFGRALTLVFASAATQGAEQTADIVKSEFAMIGVNVTVVSEDLNTAAQRTYIQHNFDMAFEGLTSANDPAIGIARVWACQPPGKLYANPTGYCNKALDNIFTQAAGASTSAARQSLYTQAQQIVDNALPTYLVGWRDAFVGVSKRVQNWQAQLSGGGSFGVTWDEAWLSTRQ